MATTSSNYKVYPSAASGISRASSGSTAWSNSAYTELVPVNTITSTFYISAITLNYSNNVGATHEVELDIATGSAGAESVIITIPFNVGKVSAVGHQPLIYIMLSLAKEVAANTRLSVRVRQSLATTSVTYDQIKILYRT